MEKGKILLEMNHVKKGFDGNGVLEDISLKVHEGKSCPLSVPPAPGSPHCCVAPLYWKKWMAENSSMREIQQQARKGTAGDR